MKLQANAGFGEASWETTDEALPLETPESTNQEDEEGSDFPTPMSDSPDEAF